MFDRIHQSKIHSTSLVIDNAIPRLDDRLGKILIGAKWKALFILSHLRSIGSHRLANTP